MSRWWQVKACLWKNQLVMQLSAPLSTAMGPFSLRLKKSVVRPSYLKLWTLSKWPNPVVLPFKIWRIRFQVSLFQWWRFWPLRLSGFGPCFWARRFKRPCSMQSLSSLLPVHVPLVWRRQQPSWSELVVVPRWGFWLKMEQFFKKCKRFKPLCLIRQGLLPLANHL